MPYSIEYIAKEEGLIVFWEGLIRGEEIIRSYHDRFSPPERFTKIRYIITDYSIVSDFKMITDDVKMIAQIANQAAKNNRNLYAVAVMPLDLAYGMARMWQAYADDDNTGWHTNVTRTRREADEWLLFNLDMSLTFINSEKW